MSKEYREISFLLKTYKVVKTPDFFFRPIFIKAYFNNLIHEEQEGEIDDLIDKKERKK